MTQKSLKMIFIYHHLIAISLTLQVSRTAPPKKHMFFEIDEFIKQLMTSEKFDEITDVIADKAAQKIRNMDGQSNSHIGKGALRNIDKQEKKYTKADEKSNHDQEHFNDKDLRSDEKSTYDHETNKGKANMIDEKSIQNLNRIKEQTDVKSDNENSNHDRDDNKGKDSRSRENPIYGHEKQKNKSSRSDEKFGHDRKNPDLNSPKTRENIEKIDTQMFLQNYMASKELELNFKHLKGELEKHRFDIEGNNMSHKGYDKNKRNEYSENNRSVDKHKYEASNNENVSFKSKLKKVDSNELLLLDGSDENEAHEQDTFHNDEDSKKRRNSEENKSTNDSDAVRYEGDSNIGFKYDHSYTEKAIPRITKQNNFEEDPKSVEGMENAKAFIDKVMDKVSQELNNPSLFSKEVLVMGINHSHGEPDDKLSIYSGNREGKIHNKITKHYVDEANGKLSMVHTSAEYAEYHENAAKLMQPKFINTYK